MHSIKMEFLPLFAVLFLARTCHANDALPAGLGVALGAVIHRDGGGGEGGGGGGGGGGRGAGGSTGSDPGTGATNPNCFPRDANVEVENGANKPMRALQIGDRVRVSPDLFSDVFMFTHADDDAVSEFVALRTVAGNVILLSPGHYLYLNGKSSAASLATVGDELTLSNGSQSKITSVEVLSSRGLYNPQTLHGDIVVNGVVASTYTTAVSASFGHAWLAPLRLFYRVFGIGSGRLSKGAGGVAKVLPDGDLIMAS